MRFSVIALALFAALLSCKKDPVVPPEDMPPVNVAPGSNASLKLTISHVANGSALTIGPAYTYTTAANDTFSVKVLKYYLTNVKLTNDAGQIISVPDSYYLIDEADALSKVLTLQNIPEGNYSAISFLIGVDSARNVSGAQTGALDPSHAMFWTWNSGYIMAKLEGSSPQSGNSSKDISFHIGGFSGINKGIRNISLNFPVNAHVHSQHLTQVNMTGDVAKWFSGVTTIDLSLNYDISAVNSRSRSVADNYAHMFTVTSVVN